FPPKPLSDRENLAIITRYCKHTAPSNFVEHGCAVCGRLVPRKALSRLSSFRGDLNL
ncbi:hypothetical protein B0H13DRAFT_1567633, partial [Mycena leptocephala]